MKVLYFLKNAEYRIRFSLRVIVDDMLLTIMLQENLYPLLLRFSFLFDFPHFGAFSTPSFDPTRKHKISLRTL